MIKKIIIGVLTSLGLLTLLVMIGAGVLFWMLSSEENGLPERMILTLDLRSGINEASDSSSLAALDLGQQLTLAETILAIEHAGRQKGVAGLIARIDGGGPGFAQSQELRQAISQFRNQGKFAWAYSTSFGEFGPGTLGYYLATAFEEVHLQPLGAVGLTGLYLETPLLQGLFEQVGVKPSGDKRGAYKSAANMFTENSLTDEHRENLDWLATSLDEQIRAGIAKGRDLTTETVGELIDGGPYSAEEAFDNRLVDRLSYWDELLAQAMEKAGSEAELISLKAFASAVPSDIASDQVVALIEGVGQIQQGDSSNGPGGWVMGSDTVAEAITDAIDDSEVRAILLRVDSGGGSAVASETIGRAVRRAIEMKKPVIVSMGNVAASGGYWIAMDATAIVADPGTLTGSIGVLAGKPVLDGLWSKIGVNWGAVGRGANSSMWSVNSDYNNRGRDRLNDFLDTTYKAFTAGVARGRNIPEETVRSIAEGRVWTGIQAKDRGLVDELGGFTEALEITRSEIGVEPGQPITLRRFPQPKPPWEILLDLVNEPLIAIRTLSALFAQLQASGTVTAPPILIH